MSGYYHRELAGVGGWLTFFLIGLGVLSPLIVIAALASLYTDPQVAVSYGDAWPLLEKIEWLLTAVQLGLLWYMAWRLLKVHVWQSVRIVIGGIWVVALGMPMLETMSVCLVGGVPFDAIGPLVIGEFVRGLIYCAIWTAYFLRSERVANTYLRQENPEAMAEVFN